MLIPDDAEVRFTAQADGTDLPSERVLVGRGTPRGDANVADESWQIEANQLQIDSSLEAIDRIGQIQHLVALGLEVLQ